MPSCRGGDHSDVAAASWALMWARRTRAPRHLARPCAFGPPCKMIGCAHSVSTRATRDSPVGNHPCRVHRQGFSRRLTAPCDLLRTGHKSRTARSSRPHSTSTRSRSRPSGTIRSTPSRCGCGTLLCWSTESVRELKELKEERDREQMWHRASPPRARGGTARLCRHGHILRGRERSHPSHRLARYPSSQRNSSRNTNPSDASRRHTSAGARRRAGGARWHTAMSG